MHMTNTNLSRPFTLILAVLIFLAPSCFSQQQSARGPSMNADSYESPSGTLEADILSYINKYRQSKGLHALVAESTIAVQAEKHSSNMAAKKVAFSHDGFEQRVGSISQKLGPLRLSAENVAYGKLNAQEVVDIWLKSPGHRKNIEGKYQVTGIGVATAKDGTIFFTQIFATKQ